jgi:hypothetical protein
MPWVAFGSDASQVTGPSIQVPMHPQPPGPNSMPKSPSWFPTKSQIFKNDAYFTYLPKTQPTDSKKSNIYYAHSINLSLPKRLNQPNL